MSADEWITSVVLISAVVVLIIDRWPPVFVLGGAVASLMFTDVIGPDIALSGLSSPAPASIGALYVVAGAVTSKGTLRASSTGCLTETARSCRSPLQRLRCRRWCPTRRSSRCLRLAGCAGPQRNGVNVSRWLIPLSFASILGGVITLIGTSANLVVSDLSERSGEPPLGVLEITVVGRPVAVAGVVVLATIGVRLLPERSAASADIDRRTREFQLTAHVEPPGDLVGRSVAATGLRTSKVFSSP